MVANLKDYLDCRSDNRSARTSEGLPVNGRGLTLLSNRNPIA